MTVCLVLTALPAASTDDVIVNGAVTGSSSNDLLPSSTLVSNSKTNGWLSTVANSSPLDPTLSDLDYLEQRPVLDGEDDDSDDESVRAVTPSGGDSCRSNGSVKLSSSVTTTHNNATTKETSSSKRSGKSVNSSANVNKETASSSSR